MRQVTSSPTRKRAVLVAALLVGATVVLVAGPAVAAPSNDNLLNHVVITGEQADITGSNVGATRQSGEPLHAGRPGDSSVWYRWTPPTTAWTTIDTCGSSFNTVVAVYTGPNVTALTEVASDSYAHEPHRCGETFRGAVHFLATAGVSYAIAVDSYFTGGTGNFELHLNPPPSNDNFDRARRLPRSQVGFEQSPTPTGWTRNATQQAGEPTHAAAGTASVWFDWAAPGNGSVTIDTCGSNFDTVLAVYTGASVGALTPIAANSDAGAPCGANLARVAFNAAIGQRYRIALAGQGVATGEYRMHIDASQVTLANDNFADAIVLTGTSARDRSHNLLASLEDGEPHSPFDRGPGRTIWYRWTAPVSGPFEVDTCDPETDSYDFQTVLTVFTGTAVSALTQVARSVNATGSGRCAGTDRSEVVFDAAAGTTYSIQVGGIWDEGLFPPNAGAVVTSLYPATRPSNDDYKFTRALAGLAANFTQPTGGSGAEAGEPAHAGVAPAASVWFDWVALNNSEVRISTCGSSFDTRLAVYTGTEIAFLQPVASNDDAGAASCGAGPTTSAVTFMGSTGTRYRIAVDGKAGATGSLTLGVVQDPPAYTGWQRLAPPFQPPSPVVVVNAVLLPDGARLLWWTVVLDNTNGGVQARRIEADGTQGPVVDLTPLNASNVGVGMAVKPDGTIALLTTVIANQYVGHYEVRTYGPDLVPQGVPVAVHDDAVVPANGRVVAGPDGTLTIAWADATAVTGGGRPVGYVVRMRRMSPAGALGPIVNLSDDTVGPSGPPNADNGPVLGISADGTVTAAWQWRPVDLGMPQVQLRPIAPDGTVGTLAVVDPTGFAPTLGVGRDGPAVLAWSDGNPDDVDHPLVAARFGAGGTLGAPVQIDEGRVNGESYADAEVTVAVAASGQAFAVWQRKYSLGVDNPTEPRGRFINSDGTLGPLLRLSAPSLSFFTFPMFPRAGFDRWGNVTTSWSLLSDDGTFFQSHARRVAPDSTLGPIADLTTYPENGSATDLVVDPQGVPLVAQIRYAPPSSFAVEAVELPVADLTVVGASTGARSATFTVTNTGPRPSAGNASRPITVRMDAPDGLAVTAASGPGWTCTTGATATCTRTGSIAGGAAAPAIDASYGTGAAPATPARAMVVGPAGLTPDPNPANDSTAVTLVAVPTCAGKVATIFASGTINGTAGDDVIVGSAGPDVIDGRGGNDTFCAGGGNDVVKGGLGDDTFVEVDDAGADSIDGGGGTDTVTYAGRSLGVTASLDVLANDGEAGEGDNLVAVEVIIGTDFGDVLSGGDGAEKLVGGGGDDQLNGLGGKDLLIGGPGRDRLNGGGGDDTLDEGDGTGADVLDGAGGTDIVTYAGRTEGVNVSLDGVANDGGPGEGDNVLSVESVVGTDQADVLTGGDMADTLSGLGGNDQLRGLGGKDLLIGGPGNDLLDGGAGKDDVQSDAGDTIVNIP